MIHTAASTLLSLAALVSSPPETRPQDKPSNPAQNTDVTEIIAKLRRREKALKSVTLEMSTTGSYPSGTVFRTDGKLRVLGTTHFYIDVTSRFDKEGVRCELRKAITPEGTWTYQSGPMESSGVYTHTDKELMQRLREAERVLAADKDTAMRNLGPLAGNGDAPLGSAMLAALDLQFELQVEPKQRDVDGVPCRVISGRWRGFRGLAADQLKKVLDSPRAVQQVEVFLRVSDGIPIRMVQYDETVAAAGKNAVGPHVEGISFELRIKNLKLDPKLDPAGFKLEVPKGTEFMRVLDHRPSRAQINRILEEAAQVKSNRPKKPK